MSIVDDQDKLLDTLRLIQYRMLYRCIESGKIMAFELILLSLIDGLAQDCSNFIANALDLLQSSAKPSIFEILCSQNNYEDLW